MSGIDAYVADLERRLAGRVSPATLDARLREVRSHLTMAATEGGEARALRRFGSPAATARALVRQARGYDARSAVSLAWSTGLLLLATFFVPGRISNSLPRGLAISFQAWLPFLGMLIFAARCAQTRRWLVLPVAVLHLVAFGVLVASDPVPNSKLSSRERALRIVSLQKSLSTPSDDEILVKRLREDIPAVWTVPVPRFRTQRVPGLPFVKTQDIAGYDLRDFSGSEAAARRTWAAYGEGWARKVTLRRQKMEQGLAALKRGELPPGLSLFDRASPGAAGMAELSTVLFAFNAFALLLGRLADALPSRWLLRSR